MGRQCGACSVCCNLLEVRQLGKPDRTDCMYLRQSSEGCCSVFRAAPMLCRRFECAWRAGELLDEERPDKIGVFLRSATFLNGPLLIAHPISDDVYEQEAVKSLTQRLLAEGRRLLLMKVSGDRELLPPMAVEVVKKDGSKVALPVEICVQAGQE